MVNQPPSDQPNPSGSELPPIADQTAPMPEPPEQVSGEALRPLVLAAGYEPVPGYKLLHQLGKGGFGEVWKAKGPGGFDVALKFIRLGDETGSVEQRSLEVVRNIRHAHLLSMFGAWQVDQLLIIAMELADRTLLQRWQEASKQGMPGIPQDELLEYMREAAKGIDFLNNYRPPSGEGVGIQHKDIKPANLLLVGGTVKVADFGLAKLLEHTVTAVTGSMTPAYAAPEFLHGQATRWSDQYSLAVSYCHLRSGRLPFEGSVLQIMAGHAAREPDLAMLTDTERTIVSRALSKKPEERWPNCRTFVEALAGLGSAITVPGEGARTVPPFDPMRTEAIPPNPPAPKKVGVVVLLSLLLAFGPFLALLGYALFSGSRSANKDSGKKPPVKEHQEPNGDSKQPKVKPGPEK